MRRRIKNCILILLTYVFLIFPSITAQAEDKSVEVNISSELRNCTVWVTPKDNGVTHDTWNVSVVSPTQDKYICIYSQEDNAYYCSFDYISAGEWNVVIEAQETIPQVQIAVRTTKQDEGMGNVSITREINGLQIYVVDNKAVVKWTDETIGNVYIEVFDTDTFEILAEEKTNKNYYECEFSDTVKKITVSVVPAESVDVKDAVHSVTLKANYTPNGTVEFNDTAITNDTLYECTLNLQQTYKVVAEVNGKTAKIYDDSTYVDGTETAVYNDGEHKIKVELDASENRDYVTSDIKIYLVEDNGSRKSFSTSVDCDIVKPNLTITYPPATTTTNQNVITIMGTAIGHDNLMIGTSNVLVNGDGTFTHEYRLSMGVNTVEIVASDNAGNETIYTANVTFSEAKQGNSLLAYILTFVLYGIIGLLAFVVYKKFKKMKAGKSEKIKEREDNSNEE